MLTDVMSSDAFGIPVMEAHSTPHCLTVPLVNLCWEHIYQSNVAIYIQGHMKTASDRAADGNVWK